MPSPSVSGGAAPTILDGGTGTRLRDHGVRIPSHLTDIWSAAALLEAPDAVVAVHREFIAAGAQVVTACNYAVTPPLLERMGLGHRVQELSRLAVELARRAVQESGEDVLVAASLPPLETSYRGDLVPDDETLRRDYMSLARELVKGADILLCETLSLGREARCAATAALDAIQSRSREEDRAAPLQVWVSWTLQGNRPGQLSGGEWLQDAYAEVADLPVDAFLVNCCGVDLVQGGIEILSGLSDRPVGGYANAARSLPGPFDPKDPESCPSEPIDVVAFVDAVSGWVRAGAQFVGGCCHTGPEHIDAVRRSLETPPD